MVDPLRPPVLRRAPAQLGVAVDRERDRVELGGVGLQSPVYLASALFWVVVFALIATWFVRWIAAA